MLARGDMNKVVEEVNRVLEGAFKRIESLEDKVQNLENPVVRGPGRPPGSKNKDK